MPLLREYKALTQTASASLFTYACELTNMDGTLVVGGPNVYFQIFDKASAAVANDVPIKSFLVTGTGPFPLASIFQGMGPIELALGLAVGISTTHEKYAAAAATYDVFGEIVEGYQSVDAISGLTTTGPNTDVGIVICAAGTPKRLFYLKIVNNEGVTVWPMLFTVRTAPHDAPINGEYWPLLQPIANGATKEYFFGNEGLLIPKATATEGAAVYLSTTAPTVTNSLVGSSVFTIKTKT